MDGLNHHIPATGVGCYVESPWVTSLSYADDMVLLAQTVTALQTLLEVCHAYAGPYDIVYNTTETLSMLARPKQLQGRYTTRVRLGHKELSFVVEFRYLRHVMTQTVEIIRILKKQFRRQTAVGICWSEKSNCSSHFVTPFMDVLFCVNHSRTLLENLLSL